MSLSLYIHSVSNENACDSFVFNIYDISYKIDSGFNYSAAGEKIETFHIIGNNNDKLNLFT